MAPIDPLVLDASGRSETSRLIRRVLQQWWLITALALVCGVTAYLASSARTKQYEAVTTIQLNEIDLAAVFLGQNLQQQGQDAQSKAATNARLATFARVREQAAEALDGRATADELANAVTVQPEADTTLIDIKARSANPTLAADMANEMRRAFIETRRIAAAAQFDSARSALVRQRDAIPEAEQDGAAAQMINSRIEQIDTLVSVSNGGVETVQLARVPSSAVSPNPVRDAILGVFLGGLLGTGIALLRARLDSRIREIDELTERWPLPVVGIIPQSSDLKEGSTLASSGVAMEAFALTRTNLRYLHVGGEIKRVVVSSTLAAEGKSTVSWNLAAAAAMAEMKVLVIDADLRRPAIAERAGVASSPGFSELLAGLATPEQVVRRVTLPGGGLMPADIDVVPAGMVPPNPVALLERVGTSALMDELCEGYDLVILDTPPATLVTDAKVMIGQADAALVVSRLGTVTRPGFDRLRALFADLDVPVLGLVVNSGSAEANYGYESYASTPPAPPQAVAAASERASSLAGR